MSIFARHTFPLLATTTFAIFMCLVLWGYNNDLNRVITPPPQPTYPHNQAHIITAYHNAPETPKMAYALATTLTQNPIQKVAYIVLLSFKPQHTLLTAYLHHTKFGQVKSLSKAAQYYFGVTVQNLSIGETLLLLTLAHTPNLPIQDPLIALQHRDALLSKLHATNTLTTSQYQTERQKALALAADHRPIN